MSTLKYYKNTRKNKKNQNNKKKFTPLKNLIRGADNSSTKLSVTDLNIAPRRGAVSNLRRYKMTNRKQTKKVKGGNDDNIKQQILTALNSTDDISQEDRDRITKIINGENFTNKINSIMKNFESQIKRKLDPTTKNKINEMILEILFQPDTSKLYSKQGSAASDAYETGEVVLKVRNKDANWLEHIKKKFRSVDSLLANTLNKCNDWACLTSNDPPLIAKEVIKIKDDRSNNV